MRLSFPAATAVVALLSLASNTLSSVAAQSYTYTFASVTSAGVNGTIKVQYLNATSSNATITADLDFSNITLTDLTAAEATCTTAPTEYAWHIHVLWPTTTSNATAASYGQCAKTVVGNHYDPLKACGPASEYVGTTNCTAEKTAAYSCSPTTYAANVSACEKGDLSGKLGKLTVGSNKKVTGTWTDASYPLVAENTAQWNMVLHAVCGTATPRVACALGKFTAAAASSTTAGGTTTTAPTTGGTTAPTPTPSTSAAAAVHRSSGALNGVVVATTLLALLATSL
ncbi:hypothetical protein Gpo141_00011310 [Globisporangium polare]